MVEPSWGPSSGQSSGRSWGLRLGDVDRQQALEALGEHFAQGRLDRDELDERSDAVWSAKTQGDLAPIFADLPVRATGPVPSPSLAPHRPRWWPVPDWAT